MDKNERKQREEAKAELFNQLLAYMQEQNEDCAQTKSATFMVPFIRGEGDEEVEGYLTVTVAAPIGSRDGEAYDGFAEAENYAEEVRMAQEKKAEAERKKQAKIERDKANREAKKEG